MLRRSSDALIVLTAILVVLPGVVPASATAVSSFASAEWVGEKTQAKNTPALSVSLELPLVQFPNDQPLQVDLICAAIVNRKRASESQAALPQKKVKGRYVTDFWTRSGSRFSVGWDPVELTSSSSGRWKTDSDGIDVWRSRFVIPPSDNRPDRIGVDIWGRPLNKKAIEENSIVCELTAFVTLA